MISLFELNEPQREAASTIEGPVLILAGAGSGKTRTITYRIAHMVDNLMIPAKSILAVSFTNKAAGEMKERVHGLLSARRSRGIGLYTFHSLGVKILKKEIVRLGYHENFSIYDQSDQLSIVRDAVKHYHADKKFDIKEIARIISLAKNNGVTDEDFANSPYFNPDDAYSHAAEFAYRFYQEKLKFYNAIDFDDILLMTLKIFRQFPEVAQHYSRTYQYIMVDEYQDTNELQFELITHLTSTHNNLCVVGDDDQSIYAFRGANIKNILNFEAFFPSAKIIKLEENYRSIMPILNLANAVIKENKQRRDKTLWSMKKSDSKPLLWAMGSSDHEAEIIVEEILSHQKKGLHLGDIAVLYRSNMQAPALEDALRLSQIPYKLIGGQKFYDKKEIKDLIGYLTVLYNPNDQIAIRRILNTPHRGIGPSTLEKYLEIVKKEEISLFMALKKFPAVDPKRQNNILEFTQLIDQLKEIFKHQELAFGIEKLISEISYMDFIAGEYDNPKQVERRKNDVLHFIESAKRFTHYFKEKATLRLFLERLLLQDSQDREDRPEENADGDIRKNEVTLMTLHASKGLEFNTVFLVGVEEETLPHKKTIIQGEDMSEERRLCYVGITRAQEKLIMTYAKTRSIFGKEMPRHKSRFLNELQALYHEQDRTTFNHMSEEEEKAYKKSFFADLLSSLD